MRPYHNDWYVKIDYNPITALDPIDRIGVGPRAKTVLVAYDDDHSDDDTIYVKPDGSDLDPGTYDEPMLTLAAAIIACDGVRDKVIAYSSTAYVFIEDYVDIVDDYCTGIFAHEDSEEIAVVVMDQDTIDAFNTIYDADEFIFVDSEEGDDDTGDGSEGNPYATIGKAKVVGDATGADCHICVLNSATYTEPGLAFNDDVKGLWAWPGETPVFEVGTASVNFSRTPVEWFSTRQATAGDITSMMAACVPGVGTVAAYKDSTNSKGKYRIVDPSGTFVIAEALFHDGNCSSVGVTVLDDGNLFFVFQDDADGSKSKYKIISQAGSVVVNATQFTAGAIFYVACKKLEDGNVIIGYRLMADSKGYFQIISPAGAVVVAATEFEAGATDYVDIAPLADGNAAIGWVDAGDTDKGKFKIVSPAGAEVVATTEFEDGRTDYVSLAPFPNGNFAIFYMDDGDSDKGKYKVISSAGADVKAITVFEAGVIGTMRCCYLHSGCAVVAYTKTGDSNKGYYAIISDVGDILVAATYFESAQSTLFVSVALNDTTGTFSIWYRRVATNVYVVGISSPAFDLLKCSVAASLSGFSLLAQDPNAVDAVIRGDSAAVRVSYCSISDVVNENGESSVPIETDSEIEVIGCSFYDNDYGIVAAATAVKITWSLFSGTILGPAIHVDGAGVGIEIEHNTLFQNSSGIRLENNDGDEVVKNNIIHSSNGYAIEADTEIETTYSDITGSVLNVVKTNCVSSNPLFIDESDDDLHLMDILGGNPATSPAKNLADDTDPDRNAGCYDTIYIGEGEIWDTETILKPREIPIKSHPVGATRNVAADGTIYSSVEGFFERVEWQWDSMENDDLAAIDRIFECMNPRLRIYPDSETNPYDFDLYTLIYDDYGRSPKKNFKLSRTGVSGVSMTVERKKV